MVSLFLKKASLGTREQKVRTVSQFACPAVCSPTANSSSSNDTGLRCCGCSTGYSATGTTVLRLYRGCYLEEKLRNFLDKIVCHSLASLSLKLYVFNAPPRPTHSYFGKIKYLSHAHNTQGSDLPPFQDTFLYQEFRKQHSNAFVTYIIQWAK